ncbi:MAG: DUF1559 domain-containing protein, partial [Thermoguttaceae bacterium]
AQIDRGTAHIIMIGEKYMDPLHYNDGDDAGDNETLYVGQDNDLYRTTYQAPQQDQPGVDGYAVFGCPHPVGTNFAFGDGSVHVVSYDIGNTPAGLLLYNAWGVRNALEVGTISDD